MVGINDEVLASSIDTTPEHKSTRMVSEMRVLSLVLTLLPQLVVYWGAGALFPTREYL